MEGLAEPAASHALQGMEEVMPRYSLPVQDAVTMVAIQQWLPTWPIFIFGDAQLAYALVYTGFLDGKTW